MKKTILAAFTVLLLLLPSCASEGNTGKVTQIRLEGDAVACDDPSVYITEDRVTITSHGTYEITGTWNNGQIYAECVDAGELNLILNNATITNDDQACLFIRTAQTATLYLEEGTVNTLTDGASYTFDNPTDDEPDAALFSKEDLVITGTGTLIVDGNYKNGIVSKDGLRIDSGFYEITAAEHGVKGKDYLIINGGELTVEAGGDGIKSTNENTSLVGYIEVNGGVVNLYSDDEAVQAINSVTVNGGELHINGTNNGIRSGAGVAFNGGTVTIDVEDNAIEAPNGVTVGESASVTINGIPFFQ